MMTFFRYKQYAPGLMYVCAVHGLFFIAINGDWRWKYVGLFCLARALTLNRSFAYFVGDDTDIGCAFDCMMSCQKINVQKNILFLKPSLFMLFFFYGFFLSLSLFLLLLFARVFFSFSLSLSVSSFAVLYFLCHLKLWRARYLLFGTFCYLLS